MSRAEAAAIPLRNEKKEDVNSKAIDLGRRDGLSPHRRLLPSQHVRLRHTYRSDPFISHPHTPPTHPHTPSPAQQMALVHAPPARPLTELEWAAVKAKSRVRRDAADGCSVCQDAFGLQPQVLLSCSHTFHRACLAGVERCIRRQCCPLCRCERYEVRLIHDGARECRRQAATRLQAAWRGYCVRLAFGDALARRMAENPVLARRFSAKAVSAFTGRALQALSDHATHVDSFLAELDAQRRSSTMQLVALLDAYASARVDWPSVWRTAAARAEQECPICLQALELRRSVLLRCVRCSAVWPSGRAQRLGPLAPGAYGLHGWLKCRAAPAILSATRRQPPLPLPQLHACLSRCLLPGARVFRRLAALLPRLPQQLCQVSPAL